MNMTLEYFNTGRTKKLVEEYFMLSFDKTDIPFQSTILPICHVAITYIYNDNQSIIFNKKKSSLNGLIVSGQFYQSYELIVTEKGFSYGFCLQPTTLYKLTKLNISNLKNKHVQLTEFSEDLHNILNPIFLKYKSNIPKLTEHLQNTLLKLPLAQNSIIEQIEKSLEIIHSKEGLLNTYELLYHVDFSQKTLETHFKKIVGLTPGRYIRLYRFIKLMRKYEGREIELKDLIQMYDYYDRSHFAKDFKHFMKQSPKDYFKQHNPLLNQYLNK